MVKLPSTATASFRIMNCAAAGLVISEGATSPGDRTRALFSINYHVFSASASQYNGD